MLQEYPYTNYHDINLDWIIKIINELNDKFNGDAPVLTTDNILQRTGNSTTDVMSQNAVTEVFSGLDDIYVEKQKVVSSSEIIPSQGLIYDSVAVKELVDNIDSPVIYTDVIFTKNGNNVTCSHTRSQINTLINKSTTRFILKNGLTPETVLTVVTKSGTYLSFESVTQGDNIIQTEHVVMGTDSDIIYTLTPINIVQTTGQSTTDIISQKGITDIFSTYVPKQNVVSSTNIPPSAGLIYDSVAVNSAISNCEYDVINISDANTNTAIPGLYDSYEKNTVYIFTLGSVNYGCCKKGNYELLAINNAINEYKTINILINPNDTISYTIQSNYNILSSYRASGGAIYNNTFINNFLVKHQSITVGAFTASSPLGSLYHWTGNVVEDSAFDVIYFPTSLNSIQAVGSFIYGWKTADNNIIHLITTSNMPAQSNNFSLEVFKLAIAK